MRNKLRMTLFVILLAVFAVVFSTAVKADNSVEFGQKYWFSKNSMACWDRDYSVAMLKGIEEIPLVNWFGLFYGSMLQKRCSSGKVEMTLIDYARDNQGEILTVMDSNNNRWWMVVGRQHSFDTPNTIIYMFIMRDDIKIPEGYVPQTISLKSRGLPI